MKKWNSEVATPKMIDEEILSGYMYVKASTTTELITFVKQVDSAWRSCVRVHPRIDVNPTAMWQRSGNEKST